MLHPHPYKLRGPISFVDLHPGPRAHQAAQPANQHPCPPSLGAPTLARPGGHLLAWHHPKPFGEVYFYQGRSHSWNPPRQARIHMLLGGGEGTQQAKPTPTPEESPQSPLPLCPQHRGSSPLTDQVGLPALPTATGPSEQFPHPPGNMCPKGGAQLHPLPPRRAWHQEAPHLLWKEQMTQRPGQSSRSGQHPETITGSQPLKSRGTSEVTRAVSSPACTPLVMGGSLLFDGTFHAGQLPELCIHPPLGLLDGPSRRHPAKQNKPAQQALWRAGLEDRVFREGSLEELAREGNRHAAHVWKHHQGSSSCPDPLCNLGLSLALSGA